MCGVKAANYFFYSKAGVPTMAALAFALLFLNEDLGQSLAACPACPQNMHRLLVKWCCRFSLVSLPSWPRWDLSGITSLVEEVVPLAEVPEPFFFSLKRILQKGP